jgi:predicted MFS family arabinose efflux permease
MSARLAALPVTNPRMPWPLLAAACLAIFAAGSILGTVLGGQLADRLPNRSRTFAIAMFGSAVVAPPLFGRTPGPAGSVALAPGMAVAGGVLALTGRSDRTRALGSRSGRKQDLRYRPQP